jgi:beta-barrel assembly-enhancing protease
MAKGVFKDLAILLIIAVLILTGGYFLARKIWNSDLDLSYKLSYDQEEKMGELFRSLVLQEFQVVENNAADTALHQITDRLIKALDSTHYRYQFVILRSKEINAFTLPGGNIYVFSGLIDFAKSPEELAAVLSHEIGHAEKRHVVSKLIKELSLSVLLTMMSGQDPGAVGQILKQILGSSFDRDQEAEADQFALELLEKSKISPKALAKFFERLNTKDLDYDESLELIMSHPHNNKRIEQSLRYKTKNNFHPVPFTINWEKVRESLKD